MEVYKAIAQVAEKMSQVGISKANKNQQQGYKFRGIDDVYKALAPALVEAKLVILPRCIEREVVERQTAKGGAIFYTTLKVEFDFVSAEDGTKHIITTYGEAMDSADKSTNKAMSAAYKYACFQAFCIPTEGDNDADAQTHEAASAEKKLKHFTDDAVATKIDKWFADGLTVNQVQENAKKNGYEFTQKQIEVLTAKLPPF